MYERVGILLSEVYEREGNLSFGSVKGLRGLTDGFYGFKKARKRSIFMIYPQSNDSTFTAFKRDAKF